MIRWVGETDGEYKMVGKAIFFNPSGALVTPDRRKHEETMLGYEDERTTLMQDTVNLQAFNMLRRMISSTQ